MGTKKKAKSRITVSTLELDTEVGRVEIIGGLVVWNNDMPEEATPDQWIAVMQRIKEVLKIIEVKS